MAKAKKPKVKKIEPEAYHQYLEPAYTVIRTIGGWNETVNEGVMAVSLALGVHRSRVYRWMLPPERGGTGGRIPDGRVLDLYDYCQRKRIPLTLEELHGIAA